MKLYEVCVADLTDTRELAGEGFILRIAEICTDAVLDAIERGDLEKIPALKGDDSGIPIVRSGAGRPVM